MLTSQRAGFGADFGAAVSINVGNALIGASTNGRSGSAYLFYGRDCSEGTVNGATGAFDVIGINGSAGGADRTVEVSDGDFVDVFVLKPLTGGNGTFVLHANEGIGGAPDATILPFDIGTTCFPFLLNQGASPVIVANNLGRTEKVGVSKFYGTPIADPDAATTTISYPPLPSGTVLTFQGVIFDPGSESSKGVSTTNAVILRVL